MESKCTKHSVFLCRDCIQAHSDHNSDVERCSARDVISEVEDRLGLVEEKINEDENSEELSAEQKDVKINKGKKIEKNA